MFEKVIQAITPNYKDLNWKTVLLILFLVAFFVRFPFFFRDYIDRDESTFIIMAQAWVDGYLPYTKLWDLKPPITFLFFASIIAVFGKSFMAIRLFGTLMVAITALFTYGIARGSASKKVSFWCAIFCVLFQSMFGSIQGVMSEHICILFFVVAIYVILTKESTFWYFTAGLLFGLSVMSKLNMAYPLLAISIYLFWGTLTKKHFWYNFQRLIALGIGCVILILLTALPYYLQGEFTTWWQAVFEAPLVYSGSKQHSFVKTLPFVAIVLGFLITGFISKIIDLKSNQLQILAIVIIGILFSFMQTGKVNGHYLIQLFPFILVPIGIALSKLPLIKKKYGILVAFLFLLLPMEAYLEYANVISNKINKGSFFNGEGIEVPKYIMAHDIDTKNIFFTEYHIGYWLLDESPPTKAATHPSSIGREELFPFMKNSRKTGLEELSYILEVLQPKTIVTRKGRSAFDGRMVDLNTYMDNYLEQYYTLSKTIDRGLIYQRLE
ncbi:MAG: glycosyltransferase family 39 protein [Flavobacteriaceae bacterium]